MWKEVMSTEYNTLKFGDGQILEAKYVGRKGEQGQKKNSNIHEFELEDGSKTEYWGSTVLDGKLLKIENEMGFGKKVQITSHGKIAGKNGGSSYYDFTVNVWQDKVPF